MERYRSLGIAFVVITLACAWPGIAARADLVTFESVIKAVDTQSPAITVVRKARSGDKTVELEVGRDAKVFQGGKAATLDELKPGQEAVITYEAKLEIVTSIEVGGPGDSKAGEIRRFEGHTGAVFGVAFSPDGKWLASSGDTTVRLWDTTARPSGKAHLVLATREPQPKGFIAVAFSPDGKILAASTFDGSIALWDMTASPPRLKQAVRKHGDPVVALAFRPNGRALVTGGKNDGQVRFWDVTKPAAAELVRIPAEKNGVWSLAFSPDGKTLAVGVSFPSVGDTPAPGEIWLWDVGQRPYVKRTVIKEVRKVPRSLAFSPDGARLAFGDGDVARVIDARTGRRLGSFEGHTNFVVTVVFTTDGKRAISGGYDNTVRLWDATTMEQVYQFDGHDGYVEQVAISPDGRLAASCGHDKSVRFWRLPALSETAGASRPTVPPHSRPVP
jgi:WD40 repeat protein